MQSSMVTARCPDVSRATLEPGEPANISSAKIEIRLIEDRPGITFLLPWRLISVWLGRVVGRGPAGCPYGAIVPVKRAERKCNPARSEPHSPFGRLDSSPQSQPLTPSMIPARWPPKRAPPSSTERPDLYARPYPSPPGCP